MSTTTVAIYRVPLAADNDRNHCAGARVDFHFIFLAALVLEINGPIYWGVAFFQDRRQDRSATNRGQRNRICLRLRDVSAASCFADRSLGCACRETDADCQHSCENQGESFHFHFPEI